MGQAAAAGTASGGSGKASASQATQVNNLNATFLEVFPASSLPAPSPSPPAPPSPYGVREFLANGSFTVPANVTQLMVEMWGAGGGAVQQGCGFASTFGGGGSGAYTRDVITVVPLKTYEINVGAGGAVGGGNGGDSQIVYQGSDVLTFAGGGQGGSSSANGAGGQADTKAAISHPGYAGSSGTAIDPVAYNLIPSYAANGEVGLGAPCGNLVPPPGVLYEAGGPGYVLLWW